MAQPVWARKIAALRKKLEALCALADANGFLPPLDEEALHDSEARLGTSLPEEFRAFLAQLSGGEEPCGAPSILGPLQGLAELPAGANPAALFPCSEREAMELLAAPSSSDAVAHRAFAGPFHGLLPIMDYGDAQYDCVVLTGPLRGTVWHCAENGFAPLPSKAPKGRAPLDVLAWLDQQLSSALEQAPRPIAPDAIEARFLEQKIRALPASLFAATGLRRLICSSQKLSSGVPREIGKLTGLRELVLSGDELESLPDEIGELRNLTRLCLAPNRLASLPSSIGKLTALRQLQLAGNQLTSLPESVGELAALEELELRDNQLTELPRSIGRLDRLRKLELSRNPLRALPEGLTTTALGAFEIKELPALDVAQALDVLARVPTLRTLALYGSGGEPLPALDRLRQVTTLRLIRYGLTALPEALLALTQLENLSLDQNALRSLPDALFALPKLRSVVLFMNPFDSHKVDRLRTRWPQVRIEYFAEPA